MEETRTIKVEDHNEYVNVETAELLKEAGFDWIQHHYYNVEEGHDYVEHVGLFPSNWNDIDGRLSAPTLEVAQRWLREMRGINLEVMFLIGGLFDGKEVDDHYYARAYDLKNRRVLVQVRDCASKVYEQALEAGIRECLKIILNKDGSK